MYAYFVEPTKGTGIKQVSVSCIEMPEQLNNGDWGLLPNASPQALCTIADGTGPLTFLFTDPPAPRHA